MTAKTKLYLLIAKPLLVAPFILLGIVVFVPHISFIEGTMRHFAQALLYLIELAVLYIGTRHIVLDYLDALRNAIEEAKYEKELLGS